MPISQEILQGLLGLGKGIGTSALAGQEERITREQYEREQATAAQMAESANLERQGITFGDSGPQYSYGLPEEGITDEDIGGTVGRLQDWNTALNPAGFEVLGLYASGSPNIKKLQPTDEEKIAFAVAKKKALVDINTLAKANFKRQTLARDLESFLAVDDVIQDARAEEGAERFWTAAKITTARVLQSKGLGQVAASHNAASKRLRVQLVRAAGDVGNINIVEQEAAEKMIPLTSDTKGTANLKRAWLRQLSSAVNSKDANAVMAVLRDMGVRTSPRGTIGTLPSQPTQSPLQMEFLGVEEE